MSTVCENNERVRRALQWALEECALKSTAPDRRAVYEQACLRFDLTPLECDQFYRLFFGYLYK